MQMTKVFLLAAACLIGLGIAGSARAADLAAQSAAAPPLYTPPFTWTGIYIGGNAGGAWASTAMSDNLTGANLTGNRGGWLAGGQMGFNYQTGNFVWGGEATGDWTSLNSTIGTASTVFGVLQSSANTQWMTTVAARLGFAVDRFLVYGKGGGGWIGDSATVTNLTTGFAVSSSKINGGWLIGVGGEYAFNAYWSAKLEYDYLGLGGWVAGSPVLADAVSVKRQINMVLAGFNYRFCNYCQ
jgi:outer membrane immunogenic protein